MYALPVVLYVLQHKGRELLTTLNERMAFLTRDKIEKMIADTKERVRC